jgi:nucleoside phosphorylase/tetratricopeptide (TPR) repeat protein
MDAELNRPIDFLIITVLEEELKAAISCLDDKIRYSPPDDPYTYYLGYIPIHNNLAYHVVVTRLSQFGGIEAGVATTQLIERWHPQKIILLGIAGGIESAGVTYGDVVIAEYVYYYEPGRQGKRKVARPLQFPCDDLLFFKARDFAIADEANGWFEDISPVPQTKLSARPAIHCAPIGSGEQVIANKIILDKLLIGCPKMKAVAMEGAGVAQACKRAGLGFLEIRGISDLADQQKDDGWHVYAAQAAALFCRLFLQSHPISTRNEAFKEEYRQQSGQHARPNAEQLFLSALAPQRFDPPFDEALLPEPEYFVGRETLLADLCQRLAAKHVTALRGMGGIGKTALASVAVRALRKEGRYQDGIVVLLCHERTDPVALLTDVLTRFDPAKKRPATAEHAFLVELAHTLLHGKDTLVVLDNVEPGWAIEQIIEPLRVAGATVLLTARHQLSFPAHKDTLSLDVLSDESALELFAQSLDRNSRFELSPMETKAGEKIIAALGNHTLAIKLAGKYVRDFQPPDLMTFAAELDPQAALKLPEGEQERIVEAVLGQSIHTLPKDALQLFANLAAFPTADFGRNAALALGLETQLQNPERCVNLLIYRGLLDIYTHQEMGLHSDRSRLHLHPLLFAFAQHLFQEEKREHQERAFLALAQYYARYTNRVSDQWLGPDEINILSLLEWAEKNKKEAVVIELCSGMRFFWRDYYRPEDGLRYLRWGENASAAVARASRSGIDRLRMANLARCRGEILFSMGRLAEAEAIFRDDLQIRQDEQDVEGKSLTLCRLGQVAHQRGLLDMAQDYFQRSLEIFREERNLEAEGSVLSHLGQIARRRGRLGEAERYFREALEIVKKTYNHRGEGEVLLFLGRIARRRGHLDAAAWNFQEALHIAREEHDRRGEDLALSYLGEVALQRGEIEQARQLFEESMHIAREIRDRRGEGVLLQKARKAAEAVAHADERAWVGLSQ